MAPPQPSPQLFVLAALAGLLSPTEATAESARGAGAGCPEGLWPLPPQVSPRVTYTRMSPRQSEDVSFLYHPCAHPWLKFQLSLLAHIYMAQPLLAPDSSLTRDRPLVLEAGGVVLEMAWLEPTWAAYWLKRRRWKKQRKKAPTSVFTLRSWRPPGTEVASRGPRQHSSGGARRRGLRAAFGHQPTLSAPRLPSASPWSLETRQPMLETPGEGGNGPFVPIAPLLPRGPEGNASSRLEAQVTKGQSSPGGCTCPSHAAPAPRAGAPPRAARGPTPRTEEAAWAAMALTFLLVLLTLATLCTRLHRNFRRGESIYWGPVTDSQDTVAAVLKRRLLMLPRRVRRSRRRPLLPPAQDSGTDGDSSD